MLKILTIANLYYASPRIPSLFYELPQYGIYPTIITPPVDDFSAQLLGLPSDFHKKVEICPVEFKDVFHIPRMIIGRMYGSSTPERPLSGLVSNVKKSLGDTKKKSIVDFCMNAYRIAALAFPDDDRPWKDLVLKKTTELLHDHKFDIIFSSSPFPTSHWIACHLKKQIKVPWIADFRDPWSQNHDYPYGQIRKWIDTKLEKHILSTADLIIAATPTFAERQGKLLGKRALVLTNGFSKPEYMQEAKKEPHKKLNLIYTGKIYQGKQSPERLFRVIRELLNDHLISCDDIAIEFYGPPNAFLSDQIHSWGLCSVATEKGMLNRKEALLKQLRADLLLLFNWEDSTENGIYPTKLFEYLATKRPILATGGYSNDGVENILYSTRAGISAHSDEMIKECLLNFINEFKQNGTLSYHGISQEVEKYSYSQLAKNLAEIIINTNIENVSSSRFLRNDI